MTSKIPDYLPSVGRLIGFAAAKCKTVSDRRLKAHGLTVQQWIPMSALWQNAPLSESELATYCKMSPSSMNRLLDRMVKSDLVQRDTDPEDQRRVLVSPTEHGQALDHQLDYYKEINEILLEGMSDEEQERFAQLLEIVIGNLDRSLSKT